MKNILLPTDFSDNSWNAIQYALELYKHDACVFHILNTYTPSIASSRFLASTAKDGQLNDGAELASTRGLKKILRNIKSTYNNAQHSFKTISSFSMLVDEVKEIIERECVDLVVVGSKGSSYLEEVFMGSNAVRIMKAVKDCPVLAVPKYSNFTKPTEIAFSTNFTRFYTESELAPLLNMAHAFKAVVRIVYVEDQTKPLSELQQFNLDMLCKYLKDIDYYMHRVAERGSISKSLAAFTEELNIHILAMLNHQHSYMEKMTREPVIKRLVFQAEVPLLVIPEIGMSGYSGKKVGQEASITSS